MLHGLLHHNIPSRSIVREYIYIVFHITSLLINNIFICIIYHKSQPMDAMKSSMQHISLKWCIIMNDFWAGLVTLEVFHKYGIQIFSLRWFTTFTTRDIFLQTVANATSCNSLNTKYPSASIFWLKMER